VCVCVTDAVTLAYAAVRPDQTRLTVLSSVCVTVAVTLAYAAARPDQTPLSGLFTDFFL
jgi:hypothetical protein